MIRKLIFVSILTMLLQGGVAFAGTEGSEELKKSNKGDKLKVKIVEIEVEKQKVRVSKKANMPNPMDFFNDKKVNDTISIKVKSSDKKGLFVQPIGCGMDFFIKKSICLSAFINGEVSFFSSLICS